MLLVGQPLTTGLANHHPVGLGYIAESLRRHDIQYKVVDMALGYSSDYLLYEIQMFQPDLIGISMLTAGYKSTYNLLDRIKIDFSEIPIVAGGPHVSSVRERALTDCTSIDYGVVLEGDETIIELCEGKDLRQIKGLMYRDNDTTCYNGDRDFIIDLDRIHFPTCHGFRLDKYLRREIPIATSRGCPYSCIFCAVHTTIGRKFRFRSPKNVVEELTYWYMRGYRKIWIQDDNFTLLPERAWQICDLIERNQLKGLSLALPNGIRADRTDRNLLKRMREVGFDALAIGVESGSERVLERIKKGEKLNELERAIKDACDLGYDVCLFFILGHPSETWQDIQASFELALKYPIDRVFFYNLIPFPGTELYEWVDSNNYFLKKPSDYLNNTSTYLNDPCFETSELSAKERKKAFAKAIEVSRKVDYNRIKHRLKRFGKIAQWTGAAVYTSNWFQVLYRNNSLFFNSVLKLRRFFKT